jgi:hypothetical protein
MTLLKATLVAFGLALPMALAGSANAHQAEDQCQEEPLEVRRGMLGLLKDKQIRDARDEGRSDESDAAAKDRLLGRVVSKDQEATIARLEDENARLRALLDVLGVDPERMLRLTEER